MYIHFSGLKQRNIEITYEVSFLITTEMLCNFMVFIEVAMPLFGLLESSAQQFSIRWMSVNNFSTVLCPGTTLEIWLSTWDHLSSASPVYRHSFSRPTVPIFSEATLSTNRLLSFFPESTYSRDGLLVISLGSLFRWLSD